VVPGTRESTDSSTASAMSPPCTVLAAFSPSSERCSTVIPGACRLQSARSASGMLNRTSRGVMSRLVSRGGRSVVSGAAMNDAALNPNGSPPESANSTSPTNTERPALTVLATAVTVPAARAGR